MNKRRYTHRAQREGLTQRVRTLLQSTPTEGLTLAQISDALDLTKLDHPKIASVLSKLDGEGILQTTTGPTQHERGPRQVRLYKATPREPAAHPRQVVTHCTSGCSGFLNNTEGDRRFWPLQMLAKGGAA